MDSVGEGLERLARLQASGDLTTDEFRALKAWLLKDLLPEEVASPTVEEPSAIDGEPGSDPVGETPARGPDVEEPPAYEVSSVEGPSQMSVAVADELAKLADLRDSGVLADSGFDKEKQALFADPPTSSKASPPAKRAVKAPFEVRSVDAPRESDLDDLPPGDSTSPPRGFGDPEKRELQLNSDQGSYILLLALLFLIGGFVSGFSYGSDWCGTAFTPSAVADNPLSGCEGLVAARTWAIVAFAIGGVLLLVGASLKKPGTKEGGATSETLPGLRTTEVPMAHEDDRADVSPPPFKPDSVPEVDSHLSLDFVMNGEMPDVLSACQRSARDMRLQVSSIGADHITLDKQRTFTECGWKLDAALLASGDGTVTLSVGWRTKGLVLKTPQITSLGEGVMGQFANGVSVELQQAARQIASQEAPVGPQFSVAYELEKLADLRDRGVLSDGEFEAYKSRLLDG